jgi:hypothetical protein
MIALPECHNDLTVTPDAAQRCRLTNGKIEVTVSKAGTVVATLEKTYEFKPNKANPATQIDMTGAHTETIGDGKPKKYAEEADKQVTPDRSDGRLPVRALGPQPRFGTRFTARCFFVGWAGGRL